MQQRRLAAIMFTDIVGYTAMMQKDEADTLEKVDRFKKVHELKVQQFAGNTLKYYGDGSLTLFDSVLNAVECALEIQQELQKFPKVPIRIGTHTGEVIFSEDDVYGDGINITSRLQSLGTEGSIIFSRDVYEKIKNHPELKIVYLGKKTLKNINISLDVYALANQGLTLPKIKKHFIRVKYEDASEGVLENLSRVSGNFLNTFNYLLFSIIKPRVWISSLIIFTSIATAIFYFNYRNKVNWAKKNAIQEIEQSINESDFIAALNVFKKARKYFPENPELNKLWWLGSRSSIDTDPQGAEIFIREYTDVNGEWLKLGTTPIDSIEMPFNTFFLLRIEKPGYQDVLSVYCGHYDLFRHLITEEEIPPGMVYVDEYGEHRSGYRTDDNYGFYIDQFEVTNKQYKHFIDAGGYRYPDYWNQELIKDEKILTLEEAMAEFTDKTGRPGPSTWIAGSYPEGQDDYPVSGISWYEAAAYAEYSGKSLPTFNHWGSGAGFPVRVIWNWFGPVIFSISNFKGQGSETVGKLPNVSYFGAYDMAGNVREWCWNKTKDGRIIRGGAWDDAEYMYSFQSKLPPFDRSDRNGFRCVKYIDKEKIPENAFEEIKIKDNRNYNIEEIVTDEVFRTYKNQFFYDSAALDVFIEERDESSNDWILEKITFSAAYENIRLRAYLLLPKNADPPYQTIVFFPGLGGLWIKEIKDWFYTQWFTEYIVKNGRAVLIPVYEGTCERGYELKGCMPPDKSYQYKDRLIKWVKQFKRNIDYLESRSDIDTDKIGYYGHSWGAYMGGIVPAVEDRLKTAILVSGGFWGEALSEVDEINYVPRIKIPVLMLNGKYDMVFDVETRVQPFYNLLGTPEKDKVIKFYEFDHMIPRTELIRETLNWLDKYLEPVEMITIIND